MTRDSQRRRKGSMSEELRGVNQKATNRAEKRANGAIFRSDGVRMVCVRRLGVKWQLRTVNGKNRRKYQNAKAFQKQGDDSQSGTSRLCMHLTSRVARQNSPFHEVAGEKRELILSSHKNAQELK